MGCLITLRIFSTRLSCVWPEPCDQRLLGHKEDFDGLPFHVFVNYLSAFHAVFPKHLWFL